MKKLKVLMMVALIAMVSLSMVGCDDGANAQNTNPAQPPYEPPYYNSDITPLNLADVRTTNFGGGTVYINGDTIEFTTGIPAGEYGQFGRQSGSVRVDKDIAALQFGIVNQLQDNDWVAFNLTFGDDLNNYTGSMILCARKEDGQLYTGVVRGWQAAAPGANNGLPIMTEVNHRITNLNQIRVDFAEDYSSVEWNGQTFSTTSAEGVATNFRSIFLIRTNLEKVQIANIGIALKD